MTVALFISLGSVIWAQDYLTSPRRAFVAPELMDAPDEWINRSLLWIGDILERFPPQIEEHPVRRAALIRLDDILHIPSAPAKPRVQKFFQERMTEVIEEIEQSQVTEGIKIWKLYNHGFFIRTASVSFTFDLVEGPRNEEGFQIRGADLSRLVSQADATFISHFHNDHASRKVARVFLKQQKPVVAPPGLWQDETEFKGKLVLLKRDAYVVQQVATQMATLRVIVYPGHQGNIPNNVYLVQTPEGGTVVHTGDQSGDQEPTDLSWYSFIGYEHDVDVFLPNCWTEDLKWKIRSVDPALVITGHENEMDHTVPHREDYTQTYNRLFGVNYPFVLMTWGESFHYLKLE